MGLFAACLQKLYECRLRITWSTMFLRCEVDERINRRQPRALFLLAIEKNSTREKCGWRREGAKNMAWVTGRQCTREQSAPQSREGGSPTASSRFSFPRANWPSENARTRFALLVSGALGKDSSYSAFFLATNWWLVFRVEKNRMLTLKNALKSAPVAIRWQL